MITHRKNYQNTAVDNSLRVGFSYIRHDCEHTLDTGLPDRTGPFSCGDQFKYFNPQWLHQELAGNAEYRLAFADRVHKHFFNDGCLTPGKAEEQFLKRKNEINMAIIAESARWGDSKIHPPRNRNNDWLSAVNYIVNNFFPTRTATVLNQFKSKGWYPEVDAPVFSNFGGLFTNSLELVIIADAPIYYTLDGSDPRERDTGNVIGTLYTGVVTLTHSVQVRARCFQSNEWSAVNEAVFINDVSSSLRITEIMYHAREPLGVETNAGFTDSDYDYVEICNIGTQTIGLAGVEFTAGIKFDFTESLYDTIAPGKYMLLVGNARAFTNRYNTNGLTIAGEYDQTLNNSGDRIVLESGDRRISAFTVNDSRAWPLSADGAGHSLIPLLFDDQVDGNLDSGFNWRASAYIDGSPGIEDPNITEDIVINEIMAHTDYTNGQPWQDSNDWIELFNTASINIQLGDWYMSDSPFDLKKWAIPSSVIITASQWRVFTEVNDFHMESTNGFGLNKAGEQLYLSYLPGTDEDRVVDCIRFKGQENGFSLGRYGDGADYWYALTPTPGIANTIPGDHVIINEIMYHPESLTGTSSNNTTCEYIEIYNPTTVDVGFWNATGSWRINGDVKFVFASNTTLRAGAYLVIVSFNPTNTAEISSFLDRYNLTNGEITVVGSYNGFLANNTGRIAIERPQAPDLPGEGESWVIIDEVIYSDATPWPLVADGYGYALQRKPWIGSGRSVTNWSAIVPTPGKSAGSGYMRGVENAQIMVTPLTNIVQVIVDNDHISGTVQKVTFYFGTNLLAEDLFAPYEASLDILTEEGVYTISAVLQDSAGDHLCGSKTITVYGVPSEEWGKYMKISFSEYSGSGILTGFPLLVSFSSGNGGFDYADMGYADGHDLRFTDSAKIIPLPYEVDLWDTGAISYIWVRIPELYTNRTKIRAYYGNTNIPGIPPYVTNGVTWSTDYQTVLHMNTNLQDSTPNDSKVTDAGSTNASGLISVCRGFDTAGLYPGVSADWYGRNIDNLTVSFWFYARDPTSAYVFGVGSVSGNDKIFFSPVKGRWTMFIGGTIRSGPTLVTDKWQLLTIVLNNNSANGYLDGLPFGSWVSYSDFTPGVDPMIGMVNGVSSYFDGLIDEVRISSVARSEDWIYAHWLNVISNSEFCDMKLLPSMGVDGDNDGMPDIWEVWYIGSTNGVDKSSDGDGDGFLDFAEYIAGTDPLDPASHFDIAINYTGGLAKVWMRTVANQEFDILSERSYSMEYSTNLLTWIPVSGYTNLPSSADLIVHTNHLSFSPVFYRGTVSDL